MFFHALYRFIACFDIYTSLFIGICHSITLLKWV
jgi:hypothetical protein